MNFSLTQQSKNNTYLNYCCCKPEFGFGPTCCNNVNLPQSLKVNLFNYQNDYPFGEIGFTVGSFFIPSVSFTVSLDENSNNNPAQQIYQRPNNYFYFAQNIPVDVFANAVNQFSYSDENFDFLYEKTFEATGQFYIDFYMSCGPQVLINSATQFYIVLKMETNTNYFSSNSVAFTKFTRFFYSGYIPFGTSIPIFLNCEPYFAFSEIKPIPAFSNLLAQFYTSGENTIYPSPNYFASFSLKQKPKNQNFFGGVVSYLYWRPSGSMKCSITE